MLKTLELEKFLSLLIMLNISTTIDARDVCFRSLTSVTGTRAPQKFCSGSLIFEDNFDSLDHDVWRLENSMGIGGGSKEFQWYVNSSDNAYTDYDGLLHIKPTLTADIYGNDFLYSGNVVISLDKCTQNIFNGCNRTGSENNIINPVRSARMNTMRSFAFKYGILEIRAKMPSGDWLFPALWLNPRFSKYGPWPVSGEIDLMESRGNSQLYSSSTNVGSEQISSTLHFGPKAGIDAWRTAHFVKNGFEGFDKDFHRYKMVWTPRSLEFFLDDKIIGIIDAEKGFFHRGKFDEKKYENPWLNGTIMAPFDEEFYIILNTAVGGTSFFSDFYKNSPEPKPWLNNSTRAAADFWEGSDQWLLNWNLENDDSHLLVDYVRVWAL